MVYCHGNNRNKLSVFEHCSGLSGQADGEERTSIGALKGLGLVKARSKVNRGALAVFSGPKFGRRYDVGVFYTCVRISAWYVCGLFISTR